MAARDPKSLGSAIAALPAAQRAAVLEVDVVGQSLARACRRLGLSPAQLMRCLAEGRRMLAAKLKEH